MKQVEVEGGELALKNSFGDIVIIPKKNRLEVEGMIKDKCWGCIDAFVDKLPLMEDYAQDGTLIPKGEDSILTSIYKKYPAFKTMGEITLKADENFTRDKTGVGDIEYFRPNSDSIMEYNSGYKYNHPKQGTHGIVYNPNTNNEQGIMLDMLHGMSVNPIYKKQRQEFADAFLEANDNDFNNDWKRTSEEYKGNYTELLGLKERKLPKKEQEKIAKTNFTNNWIDGNIRNLMFEGTSEDFKKARYWEDAKKVYLSNPKVSEKYTQLNNFLQSNGDGYMLPEVTVMSNKTK
jgi:hypothetical protein